MRDLQRLLRRHDERFSADETRVITRFFCPGSAKRLVGLVDRVLALSEREARALLERTRRDFGSRHRDIDGIWERNLARLALQLAEADAAAVQRLYEQPGWRKQLVGAYVTMEYAVASAAFFNPSIVPHPEQSGCADDELRFILSFRAVGEGHISSLVFRSGVLDGDGRVRFDEASRYVDTPLVADDPSFRRDRFAGTLIGTGYAPERVHEMLAPLPVRFGHFELEQRLSAWTPRDSADDRLVAASRWLAESNYELLFHSDTPLHERVLFPVSSAERNGIEDARFVRFAEGDGSFGYYATYTAFNGQAILPQLIETHDFRRFKILTLAGAAACGKNLSLFPRKVGGRYLMIGRQDGENLTLMRSDRLTVWDDATMLAQPRQPWEFVQVGTCGSPIETDAGWLLLTHGVGAMRRYCIGALLLDLKDPSRVIGRLDEPLLEPAADERDGYVPNVVYTCGALVHRDVLFIPYAMSDTSSGFASISLQALLSVLLGGSGRALPELHGVQQT